jgi:hypothetical protein
VQLLAEPRKFLLPFLQVLYATAYTTNQMKRVETTRAILALFFLSSVLLAEPPHPGSKEWWDMTTTKDQEFVKRADNTPLRRVSC